MCVWGRLGGEGSGGAPAGADLCTPLLLVLLVLSPLQQRCPLLLNQGREAHSPAPSVWDPAGQRHCTCPSAKQN